MEANAQNSSNQYTMPAGVQMVLWNDHDRKGKDSPYSGTQGQPNISDTNSLQVARNTWVIIFSNTNYDPSEKAKYLQIDGNEVTSGEDGHYISNLNDIGWQNDVKSFVLYSSQPSWWGSRPTKDQIFQLKDGQALFTEDDNFLGDNATFNAPFNAVNLYYQSYVGGDRGPMNGTINSLKTGENTWLVIFDGADCGGNSAKMGPNYPYGGQLGSVGRYDVNNNRVGYWKNQICSFLLYNQVPGFWGTAYPRPYIDFSALGQLYLGSNTSGSTITYHVADSTYDIKQPAFIIQSATAALPNDYNNDNCTNFPTDGWTKYHVSLTHENTGGKNDAIDFDMYFNNSGGLISIQNFVWSKGEAYNISSQFISIVDDEAWVLGTAGAIETLGISEEAADEFVDDFDLICNTFNKISGFVFNKTDNGGQYYFIPVLCHTINRICTVILNNYNRTIYTNPNDSRAGLHWSFDYSDFANNLQTQNTSLSNFRNWATKSNLSHAYMPFDQVIEYAYGETNQFFNYRTWYQETSLSTELGMLVSCKIDYEIASDKDDHIILLMGFRIPNENSTTPVLNFAQATVQFTDNSNSNILSPKYTGDNIIQDLYDYLNSSIAKVSTTDSTKGRMYLADIARFNMNAIVSCTLYS